MPSHRQLEAVILRLLQQRGPHKSICPSEAAKAAAQSTDRTHWEPLMESVRTAAQHLIAEKKIIATQKKQIIAIANAKGPIRLRLKG